MQPPLLGIASHSVPDSANLRASAMLERVHELGLDGCVFMNPLQISPQLDLGELQEARAAADSLGLYLEIGLGRISPYHFSQRGDVVALDNGDFRQGLVRMIEAVRSIGCNDLFFWIGSPADRVSRSVAWDEQVAATRRFLISLAPLLRDRGARLTLKTHGEEPSSQIVETVEMVGPDVLGIAFDPSDVCGSLEDPLAAAQVVAPYVRQLQADDLLLSFTDDGLVRQLRPCGEGVIDWVALLTILRERAPTFKVNVELHRAEARLPIFDRSWMAFQTERSAADLARMLWLAHLSETRLRDGHIAPLAAYPDRESRLAPSAAYLRRTLAEVYGAP